MRNDLSSEELNSIFQFTQTNAEAGELMRRIRILYGLNGEPKSEPPYDMLDLSVKLQRLELEYYRLQIEHDTFRSHKNTWQQTAQQVAQSQWISRKFIEDVIWEGPCTLGMDHESKDSL